MDVKIYEEFHIFIVIHEKIIIDFTNNFERLLQNKTYNCYNPKVVKKSAKTNILLFLLITSTILRTLLKELSWTG